MRDHDGLFVARVIYELLFNNNAGQLDPSTIPYALDAAVQQLRAGGASPEHWATFVHIGA